MPRGKRRASATAIRSFLPPRRQLKLRQCRARAFGSAIMKGANPPALLKH
jgi:hypothetical protein